MEQVMSAVQIVLSIFLMMGVGMFLVGIGWLKDSDSLLLSRLVVKIALPCMIISNIFENYTRESLASSLVGLIIPFLSMIVTYFAGKLFAKLLKLPKGRIGVFVAMFTFSNSVFIGLPVSQALFGEQVTPYTLLYYIVNTSVFWTIGYNNMRKDGAADIGVSSFRQIPSYLAARLRDKSAKSSPDFAPARAALARLGKMFSIPLLFFIGCIALVCLGFTPPKFIRTSASYIGKLVTPLSSFYTGMIIMRMIRLKHLKWQRGYLGVLAGRFLVSPLLLLASSFLINWIAGLSGSEAMKAPTIMVNVLLIQSAMPVMSQTPIVAGATNSDVEYATGGIAVTTALSLIFIPAYMYLISAIY